MLLLALLGALSLLAWLALALHPARPWRLAPFGEDERAVEPSRWPEVAVLVPARNEAESLPVTLPALLTQDYPGRLRIVLVDDRSIDGTARVARAIAATDPHREVVVVEGAPLPDGWLGKMWALDQALRVVDASGEADLVLLTDADIAHAPGSVRALVADLVAWGVDLDSRMARLRCESAAERLLVPAFTWFFGILYPFERVNDPARATAAAAGGCVLVRAEVLRRVGAFASLRDRLIDDVGLARLAKASGARIRLAHSRGDVVSLRAMPSLGDVRRMVARTAFTELRESWLRLSGCLLALAIAFLAPPVLVVVGLVARSPLLAFEGACAWGLMAALHANALRAFGVPAWRALLLPVVGALYGEMTLASALRGVRRSGASWRT
jgi:hopene-associated glycosyltransferase HpnB